MMETSPKNTTYPIFKFKTANLKIDKLDVSWLKNKDADLSGGLVAMNAAKWITENKKEYIVPSGECAQAMQQVENCIKHNSSDEERIAALNTFAKYFFNNPYLYENHMENDGQKKMRSKNILCYLVSYEEIDIPLGVVKGLFGEEASKHVIKRFLEDRNEKFNTILTNNHDKCLKYLTGSDTENKTRKKLTAHTVFGVVLLCFSILFVLKRLVFGVEWTSIATVWENSSSWFQRIGFLTEKSYGINHNSTLNTIFVALSLVWAYLIPGLVKPVLGGGKTCLIYVRRKKYLSQCKKIQKRLNALIQNNETRKQFLTDNMASLAFLKICPSKRKSITYFAERLNKVGYLGDTPAIKSKLLSTAKVVWLIILLAFTLGFTHAFNTPDFVHDYHSYIQKASRLIDETHFYAVKKFRVTEPTAVYTRPTSESLVVYELNTDDLFYTISADETVEDSVENAYKIRFLTEYGFLEGWMIDASVAEYALPDDSSVLKLALSEVTASSTGFGSTDNICDEKSYTTWGEGGEGSGIGEYVELHLQEASAVKMLMIQSGNCYTDWLFSVCSRPVAYTVELYNDAQLVETAAIHVADSQKKQYIHFNKAVMANKVRLIIDQTTGGSVYENAYITELAVYAENPDKEAE